MRREPRHRADDVRPPGGARLRAESRGDGLRRDLVGGDATRSVPAAGGRVHHHVARRTRHRDRGGVPAQPHDPGPHRLGSAEGLRRPLHPRPGLAGEGAQRAAVLGGLGAAGAADARGRPGAAGDLGLLAAGHPARFPRALLPVRSHDALLQPGADRASAHPDLPGRGEPADVPDRGRGRGRAAHPLLPQRALPARVRPPRGAGGAEPRGRSRADFTFRASTMVVLGDTEEERAGSTRGR